MPPPAATPSAAHGHRATAAILSVDRAIYRAARHWLFAVNALLVAYLALAALAPVLLAQGYSPPARLIYALNRAFCHQRDDRSFHVLGEKMACCQRCAALYGGLLLFGLAFVSLRRIRPLAWTGLALLSLPMAIDALTQAAGLRESSAELRVATGALFALGVGWLVFPYLERGFAEMRTHLEGRFARLVAEGRARPLRGVPPLPSS